MTVLAWWGLGGFAAGMIAGSFIATLVLRWPQGRTLDGRSSCDGCRARLRWFELLPLASYIVQRRRCRRCGAPIAAQHFTIEAACAVVGAIALTAAPGWAGAAGAYFGWLLIALAALDIAHFWLPDRLTFLLGAMGFAAGLAGLAPALDDRLIGGAAGYGVLALIAWAYRRLRGRDGMGAGDAKLLGAIGLWTGWQALPFVLLGASGVGLLGVVLMRVRGAAVAADTRLPLGALMAVAAFPVWLLLSG